MSKELVVMANKESTQIIIPSFMRGEGLDKASRMLEQLMLRAKNIPDESKIKSLNIRCITIPDLAEQLGYEVLRKVHDSLKAIINPKEITEDGFELAMEAIDKNIWMLSGEDTTSYMISDDQNNLRKLLVGIYLERLLEFASRPYVNWKEVSEVAYQIINQEVLNQTGNITIEEKEYIIKLVLTQESNYLNTAESLLNSAIIQYNWRQFFEAEKLLEQTPDGILVSNIGIERWKRLLEEKMQYVPNMLNKAILEHIDLLNTNRGNTQKKLERKHINSVTATQYLTRARITTGTSSELISALNTLVKGHI